jgi:hypothetical protein
VNSRLVPGSPEHRELFCRSFVESHVAFDPEAIEWPELEPAALERLRALPFWGEAVSTEATTASWIRAFAALETDATVREALELQALEEGRHARVLRGLVRRYGIEVPPVKPEPLPRALTWAFLRTGYGECFDSFFAFGLFQIARRSGFFPEPLVAIFDPLLQEETRHVIFFANWVAWHGARLSRARRLGHRALCGLALAQQAWGRVQTARGLERPHFTVNGHEAIDARVTLEELLALCLDENERRGSVYDARLLRPRVVPALARAALRAIQAVKPASASKLTRAPSTAPGAAYSKTTRELPAGTSTARNATSAG